MKPDGNVAFKVTWVYGKTGPFTSACTGEGRDININKEDKVWCSDKDCPCRKILDKGNKGEPPYLPCYDSAVFVEWQFGLGVVHRSAKRRGELLRARHIRPGKYAFLTSRRFGTEEKDRVVIGAYRIAGVEEDDDWGNLVRSEPVGRFRVKNLADAPKYWRFHRQTAGPRWGTGLFRYIPDSEAARMLDAVRAAAGR